MGESLALVQAIIEMALEFLVNYSFQVPGSNIFKLLKEASSGASFPQLDIHHKS